MLSFLSKGLFCLSAMDGVLSLAANLTFIDDVYSFTNIFIAWTSDAPSGSLQYREFGESLLTTVPVKNVSDRYNRSDPVFAASLINIREDTVYEFQIQSEDSSMTTSSTLTPSETVYRVKTLSASPMKTDWKYYAEKTALYAAGGVGAVILSECALDFLGFEAIGITAESVAAGVQSSIGDVAAGSIFANLQKAGMGGMSTTATFGIALFGSGVVAASDAVADGESNHFDIAGELRYVQQSVMDEVRSWDIHSVEDLKTEIIGDTAKIASFAKAEYKKRIHPDQIREDFRGKAESAKKYISSKLGFH